MRAGLADMGEAEPTVPARLALQYDVIVALIRTGYQTVPIKGGDDLPPIINTGTDQ